MNPGELRHKIIIQEKTNLSYIDQEITRELWNNVFSPWGNVETLRNKYVHQLNSISQEINTRIKVRYSNQIKELMRIKYGNKYYDVFSINQIDGKRFEMYLMCGEIVELDKVCIVQRIGISKDLFNRPQQSPPVITKYPCTFIRTSATINQSSPNAILSSNVILYGESIMDIQPGDLIEVEGSKYIASLPYKPKNHHIEVELSVKKDV